MTANRKRALMILAAVIILAGAFQLRVKNKMVDFSVNYQAAQRLKLGETLYRTSDGHYQFKYMPFSAFLYLPLTLVPPVAAKAVWYAVVVISTVLVFTLTVRLLRPGRKKALFISLTAALVLGRYFLREIELGQINALITALLLVMILHYDSRLDRAGPPREEGAAGLTWGLATALKPYALIFLPYFVLKGRCLAVVCGLAVLGLAVFSPALFYGLPGNFTVLGEWRTTLSASTPRLHSVQDNVSLMGFLTKWAGRQHLSFFLYAAVLAALAALLLILIYRGRKTSRPQVLEGFLLLALIPLVSPLGWDYTMLSSAPAVMLILSHLDKYPPPAKVILYVIFAVITLSLFDLMGRALYASFMSRSVITVCFMILIGYAAFLRFRDYA